MRAQSQTPPAYEVGTDDQIIDHALQILARRVSPGQSFTRPADVGRFFVLRSHDLAREVFSAVWLDAQHRVISVEDLFFGTLASAPVYPREVVKSALAHNAAAVIFSHNHPSGLPEPSRADEQLTQTLKKALDLVDVRTLDHIITGGAEYVSLAERGAL